MHDASWRKKNSLLLATFDLDSTIEWQRGHSSWSLGGLHPHISHSHQSKLKTPLSTILRPVTETDQPKVVDEL